MKFDIDLAGGSDAFILEGGGGGDTLSFGGFGSFDFDGDFFNDNTDPMQGVENITLSGLGGNDRLRGGAAFHDGSLPQNVGVTLLGGAGNDQLEPGAGADIVDGGDGLNSLQYRESPGGVSVDLGTGAASGSWAEGDTFSRVQDLFGSDKGPNVLGGDDGINFFYGGDANDVISGDGGNDTMVGRGGADALDGGADIDTAQHVAGVTVDLTGVVPATGEAVGDTWTGIENVWGGAGDEPDVLIGDEGPNEFRSGGGPDEVHGGGGNDRLFGENGDDDLHGEAGDDYFYEGQVANGGDTFNGGDGLDFIDYFGRTTEISATPDGVADDGQITPAEGDNIMPDIETTELPKLLGRPCSTTLTQRCVSDFQFSLDGGSTWQAATSSSFPRFVLFTSIEYFQNDEENVSFGYFHLEVRYDNGQFPDYDLAAAGGNLRFRIGMNVGDFDPHSFRTVADVHRFDQTLNATSGNTISLELGPNAASATSHLNCSVQFCGDDTTRADRDYRAMVVMDSVDAELMEGATPAEEAQFNAFKDFYRGAWLSTDAQAVIPPYYNAESGSIQFTAAAPHLRQNGEPNRGFFEAFIPDTFVQNVWGIQDTSTLSVVGTKLDAGPAIDVIPTVVHIEDGAKIGGAPVPGLLVSLPDFGYSSPRFRLFPDIDRDGVADARDDCPDEKGDAGNDGCPGHGRALTLKIAKLSGKMKMSGVLKVTDNFTACRSSIKIVLSKKKGKRWPKIGTATTSSKGSYSTTLKAATGTYRASAAGESKSGDWCDSVTSKPASFRS